MSSKTTLTIQKRAPMVLASLALNLAVLADYAGVKISDSEQAEILKQLGVEVCVS